MMLNPVDGQNQKWIEDTLLSYADSKHGNPILVFRMDDDGMSVTNYADLEQKWYDEILYNPKNKVVIDCIHPDINIANVAMDIVWYLRRRQQIRSINIKA